MTCSYPELEMKILGDLRAILVGLAFTTALPGQVDAREIIRRAKSIAERWRETGADRAKCLSANEKRPNWAGSPTSMLSQFAKVTSS